MYTLEPQELQVINEHELIKVLVCTLHLQLTIVALCDSCRMGECSNFSYRCISVVWLWACFEHLCKVHGM